MRTLTMLLFTALALTIGATCASTEEDWGTPKTLLTKDGAGIAVKLPPAEFGRGELGALPSPRSKQPGAPFQVDLRGYDLRKLDVKDRLSDLLQSDFDSKTQWPAELPAGFNPAAIMALGKNPGLGLRALQAKGITGQGVGLGIIDQGLLADHVEYADRLRLYEEIHCVDTVAAMHAPAVASLAVGKTVGVASGADLYFIAVTSINDEWLKHPEGDAWGAMDFTWIAKSIDRLLEINRALPKERKIRVISISVGWSPGQPGCEEADQAVKRATQEGVFVISTTVARTHGLSFHTLGREPMKDPELLSSYTESGWDKYYLDEHPDAKRPLVVPMDSRATASPTGASGYAFYRIGGWSWAVPYLAGLYALACQVKPEITPEEFWAKAAETGDVLTLTTAATKPDPEAMKMDLDQGLATIKSLQKPGETWEQTLGMAYTQITGEKKESMTEAEFRAWALTRLEQQQTRAAGSHRIGMIVNPARLVEGLKP